MTAARVIAGFAADLRLDDVPPAVREAACLHLIDAIGVGLASSVGEGQRGWPAAMRRGWWDRYLSVWWPSRPE